MYRIGCIFQDENVLNQFAGTSGGRLRRTGGPNLPDGRSVLYFRCLCEQALASLAHDGFARNLACVRRASAASRPAGLGAVARLLGPVTRCDTGLGASVFGGGKRTGPEPHSRMTGRKRRGVGPQKSVHAAECDTERVVVLRRSFVADGQAKEWMCFRIRGRNAP